MKINFPVFFRLSIVFAFICLLYTQVPNSTNIWVQTVYLILPIIATVSGLFLVKIYGLDNTNGRSTLFLTLGLGCWVIGELIWYVLKNFLGIAPFPSVADTFFVLGYPFLFYGLYVRVKVMFSAIKNISTLYLFGYVLLMLVLSVVVFYYGIYRAYDSEATLFENFFGLAYGVGDLFLIVGAAFSVLLVQVYKGGKFAKFSLIFMIGFLFFLLADIAFAIYRYQYELDLKPYVYIDFLWLLGYFFFAYGFLDQYYSFRKLREKIRLI
ncbi:MAG: hypothetical protein COU30_04960 [Candidatus Magasanikbacteria bacterium CG10_big_fil_rev_8_21_14_0_10_38_6]|uniref:Uncharacterized protein n=1 Tax=Candidatus Magasanikbacteria bacterium CG10_big_fil_rev_8_21_14_0_10_38_6 TaxID=1974647 RepID=A0A2M6NZW3_9BACT|nr:MAG: hypothetical protein COU30_04960 [Candidatus Magasanikbacteria bacterium CG10_big_fil_rev_8_21_14_0_10_38_6]